MFLPSLYLERLGLGWLCLALVAFFYPVVLPVWATAGVVLVATMLADYGLARRRGCPLAIERDCAHNWPVGVAETVTLSVATTSRVGFIEGEIFDDVPGALRVVGLPHRFALSGESRAKLRYRCVAEVRGPQALGAPFVRLTSPLRLLVQSFRVPVAAGPALVRVYPDFAKIAHYTLLATDHRLSQIGVLHRRRRGEGMEFHQLRDYRIGDALRQIDWKATERAQRLIAREYQDERNQQIMFLLDCGQRMRTREAGSSDAAIQLSHFDHTLNALLLLAYVALRQGDGVGMATFAHPSPRVIAPRRSESTLNRLMDSLYDLEPTTLTPDYWEAGRVLGGAVRKRSLVVVLTNLRDEDAPTLLPAVALLRKRHLVVLASLREPGLAQLREKPVKGFEDALAYAAATEYLYARQRTITTLRKSGVHCLDVAPQELPMALVNQYWSMKRSGAL